MHQRRDSSDDWECVPKHPVFSEILDTWQTYYLPVPDNIWRYGICWSYSLRGNQHHTKMKRTDIYLHDATLIGWSAFLILMGFGLADHVATFIHIPALPQQLISVKKWANSTIVERKTSSVPPTPSTSTPELTLE